MARKTKGARVLIALFAFIATTGIAAAQESEINNSLSEIESFVVLVGAAAWFVSRKHADRAQWGWRGMWGGAGMIVLSVSYNVFVTLFENLAPGMVTPWIAF